MKVIKLQFIVPSKQISEDMLFVEINISNDIFKKKKKSNKGISEYEICKEMLMQAICEWIETEEFKKTNIGEKDEFSLFDIDELMNDDYYMKHKKLREILKENGIEKFRLRLVEHTYKEWNAEDPLFMTKKRKEEITEADTVDELSEKL